MSDPPVMFIPEYPPGLFTKWSLTGGGRLREVVAMRELTVLELAHTIIIKASEHFQSTNSLFQVIIISFPTHLLPRQLRLLFYPRPDRPHQPPPHTPKQLYYLRDVMVIFDYEGRTSSSLSYTVFVILLYRFLMGL